MPYWRSDTIKDRFRFILIITLIVISFISNGQTSNESIFELQSEYKEAFLIKTPRAFVDRQLDLLKDFSPSMLFQDSFSKKIIPPNKISKKIITSFKLINPGDEEDSCYFFPDFFYTNTILYKIKDGHLSRLPIIAPKIKDSVSFRLIQIPARDTVEILAECFTSKTYTSVFNPRIIDPEFIDNYSAYLQYKAKGLSIFTFIVCGLLMMMVLFSLANLTQTKKTEFFFYAGYAFSIGLMLFTKLFYYQRSIEKNLFYEAYLDFILQCAGIGFFMAFMLSFLETKRFYPFLYKLYLGGIIFLAAVMIAFTSLHFSNTDYLFEFMLENYITKGLLMLMMIVFLIYAIKHLHNKLLLYLFWGNLLYLIFSFISLMRLLVKGAIPLPRFLNDGLIVYQLGLLIELFFFLIALIYKNRQQLIEETRERERLKTENERKELEKQVAVMQAHQEERDRISADIHDELGSGMTTIRLMSEIAKNKLKENVPIEIEKISNSSNEVLNKMNAIIWSMNSSNDTLGNLISYIRAYSTEYFDATPIECNVRMPLDIPAHVLSGDRRRNIFLCVKETLNNTLKHSKASKVYVEVGIDNKLRITISDNGIGIDNDKLRIFGNGLKNIERRMRIIGGTYQIVNTGSGTETKITLPL